MALKFPEVEKIRLKNSLLGDVVCQVKFPAILRISREDPYEFQDAIRERFPLYEKDSSVKVHVVRSEDGDRADFQLPVHRFSDRKGDQQASVAQDFYAYSTISYSGWTNFKTQVEFITQAVQKVFKPAFASRLGLRYVNIIDPQKYGLSIEGVVALLRPELTTMLRTQYYPMPESAVQDIRIAVDSGNYLMLRHGLVHDVDTNSTKYLIDIDHYKEPEIGLETILGLCEGYHETIYRTFRWCISPEGLKIFGSSDSTNLGES